MTKGYGETYSFSRELTIEELAVVLDHDEE